MCGPKSKMLKMFLKMSNTETNEGGYCYNRFINLCGMHQLQRTSQTKLTKRIVLDHGWSKIAVSGKFLTVV